MCACAHADVVAGSCTRRWGEGGAAIFIHPLLNLPKHQLQDGMGPFVWRLARLASRSGSAAVLLKADNVPLVLPGEPLSVPGFSGW